MIAMTTSNSIRVNPDLREQRRAFINMTPCITTITTYRCYDVVDAACVEGVGMPPITRKHLWGGGGGSAIEVSGGSCPVERTSTHLDRLGRNVEDSRHGRDRARALIN